MLNFTGLRAIVTFFCFLIFSVMTPVCRIDRAVEVQHKSVRCNLNSYGIENLCEDEKEIFARSAEMYAALPLSEITEDKLRNIGKAQQDMDVAAAFFYRSVTGDKKNSSFLNNLESPGLKDVPVSLPGNVLYAVVPGMFYRSNPETNADGSEIRRLIETANGRTSLIETGETGPANQNAKIICKYLKSTNENQIVLMSASKGSLEISLAAGMCPQYFNKVKGWISTGGLVKGSYAVDEILDDWYARFEIRTYFLFNGFNYDGLMSLSRKTNSYSTAAIGRLCSSAIRCVQIIGVPFYRHVTKRARPSYLYLSRYGPNDGFMLLSDSLIPGSYIYPVFRNDHYMYWPVSQDILLRIFQFAAGTH